MPITLIEERPEEADDRRVPGHWEGDLIVGAFSNRDGQFQRTSRYTILVHVEGASRSDSLREHPEVIFNDLPEPLRRSLTWDQGAEMYHHHSIAAATGMPVFFCHPGRPWQRPSNENANSLLRNYFPKGTDLRVHSAADLARVADELNRRPRKTLGWNNPHSLFATLRAESAERRPLEPAEHTWGISVSAINDRPCVCEVAGSPEHVGGHVWGRPAASWWTAAGVRARPLSVSWCPRSSTPGISFALDAEVTCDEVWGPGAPFLTGGTRVGRKARW